MRIRILSGVLGLLWSAWVWAGATSAYHLANGLTLLVLPDNRSPTVTLQVFYRVGSSYEPMGITGVSHALEHMMFMGTKRYPGNTFSEKIAAVGGMNNAVTSRDYTAYYEQLPVSALSMGLELEADRMQHLVLRQQDFAKEIQVVREERRLRVDDNPQALTFERFNAMAFVSTPYHHPVIGWEDDIDHMQLVDLQNWYQRWYRPNNAIVVIVGAVKPEQALALVKKYFAAIPAHPVPQQVGPFPTKQFGEKNLTLRLPARLPWLVTGYNVPSAKTAKVAWEPYALLVAAAVLDGGDSSRLPNELVRGQQLATDVGVYYDYSKRLGDMFILAATPAAGHTLDDLQLALQKQVARLRDQPVTQAELDRIKAQVIAREVFARDSQRNQGFDVGTLAAVNLPWQLQQQFVAAIKAVTPAQVQAVARQYFVRDNFTAARLVPTAVGKAATPAINATSTQGSQH